MDFKLRMRDLREDKDMNQTQLAKILNCSQRCISGYETGSRDIPTETIIKTAKFFNVTTDYLLGVTNQKNEFPKN